MSMQPKWESEADLSTAVLRLGKSSVDARSEPYYRPLTEHVAKHTAMELELGRHGTFFLY